MASRRIVPASVFDISERRNEKERVAADRKNDRATPVFLINRRIRAGFEQCPHEHRVAAYRPAQGCSRALTQPPIARVVLAFQNFVFAHPQLRFTGRPVYVVCFANGYWDIVRLKTAA
jgi:hypothetical protein